MVCLGMPLYIVEGLLGDAKELAAGLYRQGPAPVIRLHDNLKGLVLLKAGYIGPQGLNKAKVFENRWQQIIGKLTDERGNRIKFSCQLGRAFTTLWGVLQDEFLKTTEVLEYAKELFSQLIVPFTDNALAFFLLGVEHGVEETAQLGSRPLGLGEGERILHGRDSILSNVREDLAVLGTKSITIISIRQEKTAEQCGIAKRMDEEMTLSQVFFRQGC